MSPSSQHNRDDPLRPAATAAGHNNVAQTAAVAALQSGVRPAQVSPHLSPSHTLRRKRQRQREEATTHARTRRTHAQCVPKHRHCNQLPRYEIPRLPITLKSLFTRLLSLYYTHTGGRAPRRLRKGYYSIILSSASPYDHPPLPSSASKESSAGMYF